MKTWFQGCDFKCCQFCWQNCFVSMSVKQVPMFSGLVYLLYIPYQYQARNCSLHHQTFTLSLCGARDVGDAVLNEILCDYIYCDFQIDVLFIIIDCNHLDTQHNHIEFAACNQLELLNYSQPNDIEFGISAASLRQCFCGWSFTSLVFLILNTEQNRITCY